MSIHITASNADMLQKAADVKKKYPSLASSKATNLPEIVITLDYDDNDAFTDDDVAEDSIKEFLDMLAVEFAAAIFIRNKQGLKDFVGAVDSLRKSTIIHSLTTMIKLQGDSDGSDD